MKIIEKYTAILLNTKTTYDDDVDIVLSYGQITGPYYSETYPKEEFDTKEEALEYAYSQDKWARWLIIPIVKFDNY